MKRVDRIGTDVCAVAVGLAVALTLACGSKPETVIVPSTAEVLEVELTRLDSLLFVGLDDGTRCAVHVGAYAGGVDCDWPPRLFFDEPPQGPQNDEASRPQPSAGGPGLTSHRLPAAGRGGDRQRAGGSGAPLITAEVREAAASSRAAAYGTQPRPAMRQP